MQKSLKQIQQENRKFILEAIGEYRYDINIFELKENQKYRETLKKAGIYICDVNNKPLTLSRVLLAISKHGYYDDIWFGDLHGDSYETLEFDLKGVSFDLTKETLEEQTEETQRGLNKFFND